MVLWPTALVGMFQRRARPSGQLDFDRRTLARKLSGAIWWGDNLARLRGDQHEPIGFLLLLIKLSFRIG